MTGKAKLAKALNHEEAPLLIDIGGCTTTGIHCSMVEKLRDYYGLEKRPVTITEPMQMLGSVDEDLKEVMGVQTICVTSDYGIFGFKQDNFKEFMTPWGQLVLVPGEFNTSITDKGDVLLYAQGNRDYPPAARMPNSSFFFDSTIRVDEFDEDKYSVEENFEEFGPVEKGTLTYLANVKEQYKNADDVVIGNLGGTAFGDIALVPGPSLLQPKGIRDIEEWYISTITRQDLIRQIFDHQLEWALMNLEKMHTVLGDTIQVAYICGNDFGTQNAPFCSVDVFRKLYAPYYRRVNDWIHAHTNWKTFKHSCGSIRPLLPELIDVGFDCLNPVQWTAANMEREDIKREFGANIVYWGGGIDTQKVLPFGSPQQVFDQTLECCSIFGKGGGYVFNTIHNIQAKTPIENLVAMLDAVHKYNRMG